MSSPEHLNGSDATKRASRAAKSDASIRQGSPRAHHSVLSFQHAVGNQAVLRMIQTGVIRRLSVADYRGKMKNGNFTLGKASADVANAIGADWIGRPLRADKYVNFSADRVQSYRSPKEKKKRKIIQANVEDRAEAGGEVTKNGHITIV